MRSEELMMVMGSGELGKSGDGECGVFIGEEVWHIGVD